MDYKKRDVVVMLLIAFLIAGVNCYIFYRNISPAVSGMAVSDVPNFFLELNFSKMAFLIQWVLVLIIIFLAYLKFIKRIKKEKIESYYKTIKTQSGKSSTDIDLLYSILKKRNRINISTISKVFKIDKEKALEWAKILENNNLATINYPAFSEPVLELQEVKKEENEEIGQKEDEEKERKKEVKEKGKKKKRR